MTTLHLGVVDIPYGKKGAKTTGDVAAILEAKYGLFTAFVEMHSKVIQFNIEQSLKGHVENMMMGAPIKSAAGAAFAQGMADIEFDFRDAIDKQSYDGKLPGVPTQAALMGIRHSLKSARARRQAFVRGGKTVGGPRPSFFDTGLLSASFRAWVD